VKAVGMYYRCDLFGLGGWSIGKYFETDVGKYFQMYVPLQIFFESMSWQNFRTDVAKKIFEIGFWKFFVFISRPCPRGRPAHMSGIRNREMSKFAF
jgi:hypothetical protein